MPLLLNGALGSKCDSSIFQRNVVRHLDSLTNGVVAGYVVATGYLEFRLSSGLFKWAYPSTASLQRL